VRYTDSELFNVTEERWKAILDEAMTPRRFFEWCINRLQYLIKDSTKHDHWMSAESNHMRTYRMKSVDFYMEKIK
jgi:hypothetical protein